MTDALLVGLNVLLITRRSRVRCPYGGASFLLLISFHLLACSVFHAYSYLECLILLLLVCYVCTLTILFLSVLSVCSFHVGFGFPALHICLIFSSICLSSSPLSLTLCLSFLSLFVYQVISRSTLFWCLPQFVHYRGLITDLNILIFVFCLSATFSG